MKERIKSKIKNASNKVRFDTDTPYYNESYKELVNIGSRLKNDSAKKEDIVYLVGALLAWNQGAKHAKKVSDLVVQFVDNEHNNFKKLIEKLVILEKNQIEIEKSEKTIGEVLSLSQKSLGMQSIVMPSKLIHFISPCYFAMTDSNVSKGAGGKLNKKYGYIKYIQSLWEMEFYKKDPPLNSDISSYWKKEKGVTPMRAVDCTLYSLGKI